MEIPKLSAFIIVHLVEIEMVVPITLKNNIIN
jgi:hypothetical protein